MPTPPKFLAWGLFSGIEVSAEVSKYAKICQAKFPVLKCATFYFRLVCLMANVWCKPVPIFCSTTSVCQIRRVQVGLSSHYLERHRPILISVQPGELGASQGSVLYMKSWFRPRLFSRYEHSSNFFPPHVFFLIRTRFGLHFSCRVQQGSN